MIIQFSGRYQHAHLSAWMQYQQPYFQIETKITITYNAKLQCYFLALSEPTVGYGLFISPPHDGEGSKASSTVGFIFAFLVELFLFVYPSRYLLFYEGGILVPTYSHFFGYKAYSLCRALKNSSIILPVNKAQKSFQL